MERLRVMTLNLWNRQGRWDLRREVILQGLHVEQPDVLALQEVLRLCPEGAPALCQADELIFGPLRHVAYAPALDLWQGGGAGRFDMGNAVLSRHPIVDSRAFVLPNPVGHEPRSLVYALVDTPAGFLPVFSTHLDWQLDLSWARCQQVRFITDRIDEIVAALRQPGQGGAATGQSREVLPAVLAGDLNAEPESDEVRYLRGLHTLPGDTSPSGRPRSVYYADCFGLCGQGDGATFSRTNRFAAREREPDRRIDYIFVGNLDDKLRGEPLSARRCFTAPKVMDTDEIFASDHYGVVAEIQVGPRRKEAL